jgi:hypothetical protein
MAKKNDHLADFETENTGGVLSGFLADEEHLDRRAMLRLGAWGVASVGAIIIAVLTNQSSLRLRRDEFAAADLSRQAQQIQSVARDSQNETRRLAAAIDTLNGDRDRMYSRLTTLEQGLDSVTGAIAKQKTAAAAPAATPGPASSLASASTSATPAVSAAHPVPDGSATMPAPDPAADSEPIIGPVATAAVVTGKPVAETSHHEQTSAKLAAVAPAPVAAPAPDAVAAPSNPPATTTSPPMGLAKSMMGPPDPAAPKLVEPEPDKTAAIAARAASSPTVQRVPATPRLAPETTAAAPASDKPTADKPATEKALANAPPAPLAQVAVNRTEFGVDVGGANSVGGLRALWRGLLKSRSNAPLAALQPIIVIKEGTNGLGMQLRLVAGPLTDAATAAKICAHMVENDRPCTTTVFDGQRLAMKADEASGSTAAIAARASSQKEKPSEPSEPVAEKPVSPKSVSGRHTWHHRYYPTRPVVEEPPKKPEPTASTLSTLFSHH